MGCVASDSIDELQRKNHLVDDYIKFLKLEANDQKTTSSFLYTKAKTLINSAHQDRIMPQHNSPCCMVEVSFSSMGGKGTWGTGTLISPILALTSAMNVFSLKEKKFATVSLKFYNKKQTRVSIVRIFIPDEYAAGNLFEDYALLQLSEPVTEFGFFGLSQVNLPIEMDNFFVNMLAFPISSNDDLSNFTRKMKSYRGLFNQIDEVHESACHQFTSDSAISGAGLYVTQDHLPYIVGIQSRRDNIAKTTSYVVLLNEKRFKQIKKWTDIIFSKDYEKDTLAKIDFHAIEVGKEFY